MIITLSISTWRAYCELQLPHERYILPKSWAQKFRMIIVPGPLCWKTLSVAAFAPPVSIVIVWLDDEPCSVAASSPTSSHQTLRSVHVPLQWTPSAAGLPRITFVNVPPLEIWNSGPCPSFWPLPPSVPDAGEALHAAVVGAADVDRRADRLAAGGRRPGAQGRRRAAARAGGAGAAGRPAAPRARTRRAASRRRARAAPVVPPRPAVEPAAPVVPPRPAVEPAAPVDPALPELPALPVVPPRPAVEPAAPVVPPLPVVPAVLAAPAAPVVPAVPLVPALPVVPPLPVVPAAPVSPVPAVPLLPAVPAGSGMASLVAHAQPAAANINRGNTGPRMGRRGPLVMTRCLQVAETRNVPPAGNRSPRFHLSNARRAVWWHIPADARCLTGLLVLAAAAMGGACWSGGTRNRPPSGSGGSGPTQPTQPPVGMVTTCSETRGAAARAGRSAEHRGAARSVPVAGRHAHHARGPVGLPPRRDRRPGRGVRTGREARPSPRRSPVRSTPARSPSPPARAARRSLSPPPSRSLRPGSAPRPTPR